MDMNIVDPVLSTTPMKGKLRQVITHSKCSPSHYFLRPPEENACQKSLKLGGYKCVLALN
ncbi:hypothetical protein MTR_7g108505 [Medicago truncatula]|nr:hypothetical protein MTR_7g108505 [Medicago truncatula]